MNGKLARAVAGLAVGMVAGVPVLAQELEPGTYQNAPTGLSVLFAGYGFSTGNVLFDAALPVEGADARVHALSLGYLRTLDVFGRLAKVDVLVPVSTARFEGVVEGEFRTRSPRGLADPRVRLQVNLAGSPALDLSAFGGYRQRTIVGVSLQVALPLGQYDSPRLINLGANRWSFRPELGLSHARGRWVFEVAGGAWLFTDNDDFFGGSRLGQRPLYFGKGSVIRIFRRNLWTSVSYGHATGGTTTLNGTARQDVQKNNRVGATVSFPAGQRGAIRLLFTTGLTTRLGSDFDSVGMGYQYTWGSRRRTP